MDETLVGDHSIAIKVIHQYFDVILLQVAPTFSLKINL